VGFLGILLYKGVDKKRLKTLVVFGRRINGEVLKHRFEIHALQAESLLRLGGG
jgi:hypothetical protein